MMKLAVSLLLGVFCLGFTMSVSAGEKCSPLSGITEYELDIITRASRSSAERVLCNAASFKTTRNLVYVYFKDGTLGVYGAGSQLAGAGKGDDSRFVYSPSDYSQSDQEASTRASYETYSFQGLELEQQASQLLTDFVNEWPRSDTQKTPEKIAAVDALARQYIGFLATNPDLGDYFVLGRRGNRYLADLMFLLPYLSPKKQLGFYEYYVSAGSEDYDYIISPADIPSFAEKYAAVQEIKRLLLAVSDWTLGGIFSEALKTIDPLAHSELEAAGRFY